MYDPQAVLAAIDSHTLGVLALAGIAVLGMAIWFWQGFTAARRDCAYAFPVVCTTFWFAHDLSYVARFHEWFSTYHHWFPELFWGALVVTTMTELVFLAQTLRYGRAELSPAISQRQYAALLAAAVVSALVIWWTIKTTFDDDLYIIAFGLTLAVYPPFAIAMTVRRRSARGQSPLMWVGFTLLAISWFTLTAVYLGPAFRSGQWLALGVLSVLAGFVGIWLITAGARYGVITDTDAAGAGRATVSAPPRR